MRTYLDHAASSPTRPDAIAAMERTWGAANPSSLHTSGRRARGLVEDAREAVASCVGAQPSEVIFTSGGTEADNIAVLGASEGIVACSAVEHPAVFEAVASLGPRRRTLPVSASGEVDLSGIEGCSLASVMAVNNETGVASDLGAFVEACRRAGTVSHSDGVQALGHRALSFDESGLDLMSLSAHKVGGPVGIGALIVRRGVRVRPIGFGGGQEARLRSGTVPVALSTGFGAAAVAATESLDAETSRMAALRTALITALTDVDGVRVVGDEGPIVCVVVDGCRSEDLLLLLDAAGIDASAGSACSAGVSRPSRVLLAMGYSEDEASSIVRFSMGWTTTRADIDAVADAFPGVVESARAARRVAGPGGSLEGPR